MYADLVLVNGTIRALDGKGGRASSLAVVRDRIVEVSADTTLEDWVGPQTRVVNLGGRTVLPGFNEAHCHVFIYGQSKLLWRNLRPDVVDHLDDVLAIVREEAERLPPGRWIRGRGFDLDALPPRFAITRHDLDPMSPDHPVCLTRLGGHLIVGNSYALRVAGITRDTPDPLGGQIDRDATGEPTGVFREAAQPLLYDAIPPPSLDDTKRCLLAAAEDYLAAGITSVQNAGTVALDMKAFQHLHREGHLPLRVYLMVKLELFDSLVAAGVHTGLGDDFLRIGPLKIFLDGSIGAHTAAMCEPYLGDPDNRGILWLEQEELNEKVAQAHDAGFQIAIHAIGDRAIDSALTAYERALRATPNPNHRHRIEHCELCTGPLLDRVAQLGALAVPQPIFLADMGSAFFKHLGAERAHQLFPLRSLMDRGVVLAGSSDSPVASCNPLEGVQTAVTRRMPNGDVIGPGEQLSVAEALRMYTWGGAYASFDEKKKGSIAPGQLADLVVLDRDPFEVSPDQLETIQVDVTIAGGRVAYERG